ncbi:MAG: hypothetical protein NZZ41_04810 [Candidatus Dojkabacteria bacterium]|nr:hypothetical protein [Candidatus Dojkabacteria bacterium]
MKNSTIIHMWLVNDSQKPYILTNNKERAEKVFNFIKNKKKDVVLQKISDFPNRICELGRNLFEIPTDKTEEEIIHFRNTFIKQWRERVDTIPYANEILVWKKMVKNDQFLNKFDSAEQFSQWAIDHVNIIRKSINKIRKE